MDNFEILNLVVKGQLMDTLAKLHKMYLHVLLFQNILFLSIFSVLRKSVHF